VVKMFVIYRLGSKSFSDQEGISTAYVWRKGLGNIWQNIFNVF